MQLYACHYMPAAILFEKHAVPLQLFTASCSKRNTEMLFLKALTTSVWKGSARDKRLEYLDHLHPRKLSWKTKPEMFSSQVFLLLQNNLIIFLPHIHVKYLE